jgi:hypothetical protein
MDVGFARPSVPDLSGPRRRASERCNIARGTAQRAFVALQERGFIDCTTKGAFSRKDRMVADVVDLRCYRRAAEQKFMNWGREKQNTVSKYEGEARKFWLVEDTTFGLE